MDKYQYSQKEMKIINSIRGSVYRALWGEVIPSMRGIILHWDSDKKMGTIVFYHDGPVSSSIQLHYSTIMTEVEADYWGEGVSCDYRILRCDAPEKIPTHQNFMVYLRKEPFVDPKAA